MKQLGKRCNLIPVIAKADTLTPDALLIFKDRVRDCIATHNIQIYSVHPIDAADEPEAKAAQALMVCFLSFLYSPFLLLYFQFAFLYLAFALLLPCVSSTTSTFRLREITILPFSLHLLTLHPLRMHSLSTIHESM